MNQALFFNAHEEYRIDHVTDEGDACLSIDVSESALAELSGAVTFSDSQRHLQPDLQLEIARLRLGQPNSLVAEETTLRLVHRLLIADRTTRSVTTAQRRLVQRAKQTLHADPRHRWSLSEIAKAIGTSPVHLTQTFSKAQGMPLYRYQTQLRLALALHELPRTHDLAALALDLGFSSHSQFTTAFRRVYGVPPSALKNRKAAAL